MDGHQWLHRPFRRELRNNCVLLEFPAHSLWVFAAQLQAQAAALGIRKGEQAVDLPCLPFLLLKVILELQLEAFQRNVRIMVQVLCQEL